jgi:hypothetical protein
MSEQFLFLCVVSSVSIDGILIWLRQGSIVHADNATPLYPPKLVQTSPTSGGCSRTRAMEVNFYFLFFTEWCQLASPRNLECQVPRNRVASYAPGHWVPFLSPLATQRATVRPSHETLGYSLCILLIRRRRVLFCAELSREARFRPEGEEFMNAPREDNLTPVHSDVASHSCFNCLFCLRRRS